MKKIETLEIPEVKVIWPNIFADHRGHFLETYSAKVYKDAGIDCDFIQDNQSYSATRKHCSGYALPDPALCPSKTC